jgi:hypothetical protein
MNIYKYIFIYLYIMDQDNYYYDDDIKEIDKIEFDIFGNEEVKEKSVLSKDSLGIDIPDLYDNLEPKQGGLIDAGVGIIEDLSSGSVAGLIGAVQKAGTAYNTFKDKNIRSIVNQDLNTSKNAILQQSLPGAIRGAIGQPTTPNASAAGIVNPALQQGTLGGIFFPTPPRTTPAVPNSTSATTGNP